MDLVSLDADAMTVDASFDAAALLWKPIAFSEADHRYPDVPPFMLVKSPAHDVLALRVPAATVLYPVQGYTANVFPASLRNPDEPVRMCLVVDPATLAFVRAMDERCREHNIANGHGYNRGYHLYETTSVSEEGVAYVKVNVQDDALAVDAATGRLLALAGDGGDGKRMRGAVATDVLLRFCGTWGNCMMSGASWSLAAGVFEVE